MLKTMFKKTYVMGWKLDEYGSIPVFDSDGAIPPLEVLQPYRRSTPNRFQLTNYYKPKQMENFDFVSIPFGELSKLPPILGKRLPKSAQLLGVVQICLNRLYDEVDYKFYHYNGINFEETCFLCRMEEGSKINWQILTPAISDNSMIRQIIFKFAHMLDWNREINFVALDKILYSYICEICPTGLGRIDPVMPGAVYIMPKETALNQDMRLPPGTFLRPLMPNDFTTVFDNWTYKDDNADVLDLIAEAAMTLGSAGLWVDEILVSWGLVLKDAGIHIVGTLPEYRGRGYAKIIMRHLSKGLVDKYEIFPIVHVAAENEKSIRLMRSVGFEFSHKIVWSLYYKNQ